MATATDIETKAVELMDKLDNLLTQYSPEVYQAAVDAMRVHGLNNLLWGVYAIGFIWLCYYLVKRTVLLCKFLEDSADWRDNEAAMVGTIVIGSLGAMFSGIGGILHIVELLKLWNWVALFDPELALARKVLGL